MGDLVQEFGKRLETRSMRRCVYRKQLDLETLVSTRGPNFPISRVGGEVDVAMLVGIGALQWCL